MDFIFISMPYAKFDSRWFCKVPNINLGILEALLTKSGRSVKSFHFHLDFLPYLGTYDPRVERNFRELEELFGVEYLGLDYVFASILFENKYLDSREVFMHRLDSVGLTINEFDELIDVGRSFVDQAFSRLSKYLKKTKLVGFSCSHYQLSGSLLMSSKIKATNPDIPIIFGGKDCSGAFGHELLSNMKCLDFVGTGECELTILSLLDHMDDRRKPLFNLLFRDNGSVVKRSKSRHNLDLNSLPFPKYHFQEFPVELRDIILPLEIGRGCPWKRCTFCPDKSYNVRCQSKTPQRIQEEIEHYQGISNDLQNFIILDPDSLKNSRNILKISEYFKQKHLCFHFAEFRAKKMDRKVVKALSDFGDWVTPFQVGIETFSDRVLKLMKKGTTVLKNVEVLKMVAELDVPLQFNLFTSYPLMDRRDLRENIRIMDLITHLLVPPNISIYPGEFYLPTDCEIFLDVPRYKLRRDIQSIFSSIFFDFEMPSFSNYPYPYLFSNQEEQMQISSELRHKVSEIKNMDPEQNFMYYRDISGGLEIVVCKNGGRANYVLTPEEKKIYLSAIEVCQDVARLADRSGMPRNEVYAKLDEWNRKGLVLYSPDKKSFISLAMRDKRSLP